MMKTSLFASALLLTFTAPSVAQQRALGLDFNPEAFKAVPTFSVQGEKAMVPLPLSADLTQYAPPVGDQGSTPSCVAWSTAYGAFTVQYAAQKKIQNKSELQRIALSAMLPYMQLRPHCNRGLDLPNIAEHILQNGDVSHTEFGAVNCGVPVSSELLERARQNRPIKEVVRLFDETNTNAEKIFRTKEQIGRFSTPVIVGIQATRRLSNLTDEYYRPEGEVIGLHAVTVVGYDATSFKILNSWGLGWGKNGYFSIRFEDFARIAVGGVVLVLPDGYMPGPRVTPTTTTRIGGTFAFQYFDDNGKFQRVAPRHTSNGVYDLARKNWTVGQQFQLLTKNTRQAQYMCVFSIDKDNVVNVHWPVTGGLAELEQYGLTTKPVTDVLPKADYDLVIPANDDQGRVQALNIDKAGTDYLCVLYSDKPLKGDIIRILTSVKNASGDIYSRLQSALGNRLVPVSNIQYEPNQMGANTTTSRGYVVPLVLKLQSVN